jgi:hypothetical protein
MDVKLRGLAGGGEIDAQGAGARAEQQQYDVKAQEEDAVKGFQQIQIVGIPGKGKFSFGAKAQGRVRDEEGKGEGKGETEGADGGSKILLANLSVDEKKCGFMKGKVDASEIQKAFKVTGTIKVIESEWTATLDERDEAFEKQVESVASEPVPAELSWAYLDQFARTWAQLREGKSTSYGRCVLKKLDWKYVLINRRAAENLAKGFPKAADGANCTVMRAALGRFLQILRFLQLSGSGGCPEVEGAYLEVQKQIQLLVKSVLARPHTWKELQCFHGLLLSGMLGDQAQAYQDACQPFIDARAAERAAGSAKD